jgi:DNA helicase-2/ATP-dependent DNA helicase PcrA
VLSTVHSAKGLEWKVVFIIWAADGRFPASYALQSRDDLEEERRLMYVAATRAEDSLYIICPLEKTGGPAGAKPRLSRLLADLPAELVCLGDEESAEPALRPFPDRPVPPIRPATAPVGGFAAGDRVSHPVFGVGRVLGFPNPRSIRIEFDHFGTKNIAVNYAGLVKA